MFKKIICWIFIGVLFLLVVGYFSIFIKNKSNVSMIQLPSPQYHGVVSIEQALLHRHSSRHFNSSPVSTQHLGQLLWAGQGIRNSRGYRTAPSAGAKYPIELYVLVRNVKGVEPGFYHFITKKHRLEKRVSQVDEVKLNTASLNQAWVKKAPVVIIIASDTKKMAHKYHAYAFRYVLMEAGHVAQNMMLQSVSLKLGIVGVGGFDEKQVKKILNIHQLDILYLICVGNID